MLALKSGIVKHTASQRAKICLKNGNGKQTANKIKVIKRGCFRLFSPDVN